MKFSSLPDLVFKKPESADAETGSLKAYPQLILGVVALFLYVGVEVIAGDTIGLFGSQLGSANASSLTSYTMAFMVLGYLIGLMLIPSFIDQAQALAGSAILGLVLSGAVVFADVESTSISFFYGDGWG